MVQLLVTTIFLRVLTFVLSNSVASSDGYLCSQVCNLLDFYQRTIKNKRFTDSDPHSYPEDSSRFRRNRNRMFLVQFEN